MPIPVRTKADGRGTEPAELQKLANAFDAAWISINTAKPIEPLQVSAERERFGCILAHLWQSEPHANLRPWRLKRFSACTAEAAIGCGISPIEALGQQP